MYRDMKTNLPKDVMMYPDVPYRESLKELFVHHTEVRLNGVSNKSLWDQRRRLQYALYVRFTSSVLFLDELEVLS